MVSDKLVLTAAHCVKEHPTKQFVIHAGSNSIKGGNGGVKREITDKIIHEQYEENGLKNDIALLRVTLKTFL